MTTQGKLQGLELTTPVQALPQNANDDLYWRIFIAKKGQKGASNDSNDDSHSIPFHSIPHEG